jgi:WD40 repeat protein
LLAVASDGRRILSDPGVYDVSTPEQPVDMFELVGHEDRVRAVTAFTSADGHVLLATGGNDKTIRIWDPVTGQETRAPLRGHEDRVRAVVTLSVDGRILLASGSRDGTVRFWDPGTGRQALEPLTGHTNRLRAIAPFNSADGRTLLAIGSTDGTLRILDPLTGREELRLVSGGPVVCIHAFSMVPDDSGENNALAIGGPKGLAVLEPEQVRLA